MKLVNQQLIKDTNLKRIYNYIQQQQGISRVQMAKYSHLSKTTVSALVDELIKSNFVVDAGVASCSSVGRKPNSLHLKPGQYYVAVFYWDEQGVFGQLVDICGSCFFGGHLFVNKDESYVDQTYSLFTNQLLPEITPEVLLGVCIVVPAMIDPDAKEIYATTFTLPSKEDYDVVEALADKFHAYPVALLNDTACNAYAEKIYAGVHEKDFAFIHFSRGIGATLFIQDSMIGKATASYTQFGHYSIDPHGKLCSCGNRGCLELMIGEDSLPERIAKAGGTSSLRRMKTITYKDLGQAAIYGDETARKVIHQIASDFSQALSNLVCTVHPKLIIIGGKGKDLGPCFLEDVKDCLRTTGFRRMLDSVKIRYSFLDENACYSGAMKYFFDTYYNFTQDLKGQFFIG